MPKSPKDIMETKDNDPELKPDLPAVQKVDSKVAPAIQLKQSTVSQVSVQPYPSDQPCPSYELGIKFTLKRVANIDNVNQTFDLKFFMEMLWEEPSMKGMAKPESSPFVPPWIPPLEFMNAVAMEMAQPSYEFRAAKDDGNERGGDQPVVVQRGDVTATFAENLELRNFPFDVQDLTVALLCPRPTSLARFVPHPQSSGRPVFFFRNFTSLAEWTIPEDCQSPDGPHPWTIEFSTSDPAKSATGTLYSRVHINIKVVRRWPFYIFNVFLMLFCLGSCSFTVYSIPPDDVSGRLGTVFGLLLTAARVRSSSVGPLRPPSEGDRDVRS